MSGMTRDELIEELKKFHYNGEVRFRLSKSESAATKRRQRNPIFIASKVITLGDIIVELE